MPHTDPARKREYEGDYRARHRQHLRDQHRAWSKQNRHRTQTYAANKRAARMGVEGKLAPADWLAVLEVHEFRCARCSAPSEVLDHIMPLGHGGLNLPVNIQPLCRACDAAKVQAEASAFGIKGGGRPRSRA